ncbi:MAG: hypothetical protein ACTHJ4_03375, partial [Candidatus Nucleicultricaceae bacterium]
MRIITSMQLLFLLLINSLGFASVAEEEKKPYLKVKTHNVGQGNCITAELYSPEYAEVIYLLVDAGSSAYNRELHFQEYFRTKAEKIIPEKHLKEGVGLEEDTIEEKTTVIPISPSSSSSSTPIIPQSILREISPGEQKVLKKQPPKYSYIKERMIQSIRDALGQKQNNSFINVTTFFISHPDSDHYELAPSIFHHQKDQIQNIILGGLPEKYAKPFRDWVQELITNKKTKVYFPALLMPQPVKSVQGLIPTSLDDMGARTYAPQMFSHPKKGWRTKKYLHLNEFEKAIPFGDNIKTYLLSVNPTHWCEAGTVGVVRSCLEDDDNSDSLVLKIAINKHSIIITGDATNITTDRIIKNYESDLNFLECTVITSDHHGAKTHGSNQPKWAKTTAPQHVIFSCGIMHGHPSLSTYDTFKQSNRLAIINSHDIWVWQGLDKKDEDSLDVQFKGRKAIVHKTCRSLLSTFSSGTLSFMFTLEDEIKLESELFNLTSNAFNPKVHYTIFKEQEKSEELEELEKEITFDKEDIENLEESLNPKPADKAKKTLGFPLSPTVSIAQSQTRKKQAEQSSIKDSRPSSTLQERSDKEAISDSEPTIREKRKTTTKEKQKKSKKKDK